MFHPHTLFDKFIATKVCSRKLFHRICSNFLFTLSGFDPQNLNMVSVSNWVWENIVLLHRGDESSFWSIWQLQFEVSFLLLECHQYIHGFQWGLRVHLLSQEDLRRKLYCQQFSSLLTWNVLHLDKGYGFDIYLAVLEPYVIFTEVEYQGMSPDICIFIFTNFLLSQLIWKVILWTTYFLNPKR